MDPTGAIVSFVVKKLGELILSEVALLRNTKPDLEWVQSELRMMQSFLDHVAAINIQDARITSWTEDVRRLAFHAEDVVDTFSLHDGDHAVPKSCLPCFNFRVKSRHDFGVEIAQLRKSVAELASRKATYDIKIPDSRSTDAVDGSDGLLDSRRLTKEPYAKDEDVVGLDRHMKAVIDLLEGEGSRRSAVAIVGMGGLGKTTLAKNVYKNIYNTLQRSSSSFGCTAWVCVSQKYNIPDLLRIMAREILKLSQKDEQEMNHDTMSANLCEFLRSKKYLIVLDDVWSSQVWDTLGAILPEPNNGSRVIITTRNMEVARSANPAMQPYELSALDEEESRALFTKRVFPNEEKENSEQFWTGELASIREKILKKCGGLPLAIIVAGGLFSVREKSLDEWKKVTEKIEWRETEKGEQCMRILALSYMDLPAHLKWCFLYLAAIPEDCEIYVDHLKRLWVAEGFIEEKEGKALEDTAERYLEELVRRCLIQVVGENTFAGAGDRKCCVHDMVLELAVSEAKKIWFMDVWRSGPVRNQGAWMRRLSITHYSAEINLPLGSNKLRTLLISDRWEYGKGWWWRTLSKAKRNLEWHSSTHKKLELLRVLQLGRGINRPPEGLADMVNLRYLKLSSPEIEELPSSLGNLRHLQTLDIQKTRVIYFPRSIWQIRTLRYVCGGTVVRTRFPMPKDSTPLEIFRNLRTLLDIHADPWMEIILPNSINLEEFRIRDDGMPSMTEYLANTINQLQWLHQLFLHTRVLDILKMDEIFSSSECHINLQSLWLSNSWKASLHLSRLPQNLRRVGLQGVKINHDILGLLGKLKHLHRLEFYEMSFVEEKMVFNSGWFPQLHDLCLSNLDIKNWEVEKGSLPLLRSVHVHNCPNVKVVPEGLQHMEFTWKITP